VIVGYYREGKLYYAAKVQNSFVPRTRSEVFQLQWAGNRLLSYCYLAEKKRTQWALTREQMKDCVWLRPERVAQIEFTEWTPDGHLRHSRFVGLREDKDPRDVVREVES
jgi:ATP-dependent DNA ligase